MRHDVRQRHFIVCGGGAAGLSCARHLLSSGASVTLFEASQRVGGRCRTERVVKGASAVELGASYFHGTKGNPAWELCTELGLLSDHPPARPRAPRRMLCADGRPADADVFSAVHAVLSAAVSECEAGTVRSASVGEHLQEAWETSRPSLLSQFHDHVLVDAVWRAALLYQAAVDGAAKLTEQGTAAYSNYDEFNGQHVASRADLGGFSLAMEALASPLRAQGSLQLGACVVSVHWHGTCSGLGVAAPTGKVADGAKEMNDTKRVDGLVEVVLADGTSAYADAVCVALPLLPLRQLHFEPALPPAKVRALEQLRLGSVEKLFVTFECDTTAAGTPGPPELPAVVCLWTDGSAMSSDAPAWTRDIYALDASAHEAIHETVDEAVDEGVDETRDMARDKVEEAEKANAVTHEARVGGSTVSPSSRVASGDLRRRRETRVAWLTGDSARAVSGRSGETLLEEFRIGLAPFLGELEPWRAIACYASGWSIDPLIGGAYSFPTRDAPANVASHVEAPLEDLEGRVRVCFAGEHTSKSHFATVAGALESGRREADRMMQAHPVSGNTSL